MIIIYNINMIMYLDGETNDTKNTINKASQSFDNYKDDVKMNQ